MVADVHVNRPCVLQSRGGGRWDSHVTLYGCTMGGGVIWMVGTGGIVGNSPFVTVLSFALGTRFAVLGSGLWKTEKTKLKRDRLKPPLSPHGMVGSGKKAEMECDNDLSTTGRQDYPSRKPNKAKQPLHPPSSQSSYHTVHCNFDSYLPVNYPYPT